MTVERMQIWWRLETFVNHRIRNASKGVTLALCFDVVDLNSFGVDLGHGLGFYREEETPERKQHIQYKCIDAQSSMMI
jgi:hypothetical protein